MASANPSVSVPGEVEHDELIRKFVEAAWLWGQYDAKQELARKRFREFEIEPPVPKDGSLKPKEAIEWARRRTVLQGKWHRDLDSKVTQIIVHGLETGASNRQVMKALTTVFPQFSKARLENIVRTESMSAYNQGILATYRNNRFIVAVQFNAILDARTTPWCRTRDGLVMRLDDERLAANTPPLHYQCRSVFTPMDQFDFEDLQNGDPKANRDWFSHVPSTGPKSLTQALSAWDGVPAAQAGFGSVPELEKASRSAQAKKPQPSKAPQPAPTPSLAPVIPVSVKSVPVAAPQFLVPAAPAAVPAPAALPVVLPTVSQVTVDDFANHGFGLVAQRVVDRWNDYLPGIAPKDFFAFLGQDYSIHAIGFQAGPTKMEFSLRFKHNATGELGLMSRQFYLSGGKKTVEHAFFKVPTALQKDGLAKRMLAHTVGAYQQAGINRITVHANIDVGSYAWARYGFRLRNTSANRSFKSRLQSDLEWIAKGKEADRAEAARDLLSLNWSDKNPEILMQVARNKLLGKEVLMNEHWWGELKLGNLKHMETFWNYTDPDNSSERLKPLRKKPK